jgi:ABC-type multidrug transport system ATPase subunit
MEVMYSFDEHNSCFHNNRFLGFIGESSDLLSLVPNTYGANMKLNMTVKKTIQNNLKFLDLLGLSRELLKMKIKDLSYSQYKLVMLMQVCNMSPKVVILNNFDLGFNHKMKSKISKFIKTINANSKTKFIIITNDIFFINKNAKNIIIAKNKIIKYQGDIISAIKQNLIEKPEIIKFIDLANEKGANLDYTLDSRELLKAIYRSVF